MGKMSDGIGSEPDLGDDDRLVSECRFWREREEENKYLCALTVPLTVQERGGGDQVL